MKIPVGKTIAYAYSFTFGNFLTLLGLSWVAHLIATAANYLLMPSYIRAIEQMNATDRAAGMGAAVGSIMLLSVVTAFSIGMISIAFSRQALGLRNGPAYFYFSLDRSLWRLLGAYLLFALIFFGVILVVAMLAGFVVALSGFEPQAGNNRFIAVIVLMIFALTIYFALRMGFFMPTVAGAEGQHILRRSWLLSRGNFWRLFAILLLILLPFIVIFVIYQQVLISFLGVTRPPAGSDPQLVAAYTLQVQSAVIRAAPYLFPVTLAINAALFGCVIAASAFAYRALVPASDGIAAEFA